MSDEPKVLAATVMRSLPSGAYHARRALASLESQNQALQERIEELKTLLHEERLTRYKAEHSLAELVRRYELRIEQAVAPQETDPEHLHKFGEHGTCECGATPGWPDVPNQSAEESG